MYGGSGTTQNFVDFWQWDGERWSEITMTGPNPGVRYSPGMVYDASRGRVVLYGGLGLNAQGRIGTTLAIPLPRVGERWQPVVPRP
jgi:hypothetical protein